MSQLLSSDCKFSLGNSALPSPKYRQPEAAVYYKNDVATQRLARGLYAGRAVCGPQIPLDMPRGKGLDRRASADAFRRLCAKTKPA